MSKIWLKAQKSSKSSQKKWGTLEENTVLSNGVFGIQKWICSQFMAWFEVRFVCHYLETPYFCTYDIINWVLSDNQSMYNASIKLCTLIGYITNFD